MLTIIHAVASVIHAVLRDVANVMIAGGAILSVAVLGLLVASVTLGFSGLGAFRLARRRRSKQVE